METFVLMIWLTQNGPEIKMRVPDCEIGAIWYEEARAWAARSGVAADEPGFLCGDFDWSQPRLIRAHR